MRYTTTSLIALAGTLTFAATANAQEPGAGLLAWTGCWEATTAAEPTAPAAVCFLPTAEANVVEIATLEAGTVVSRDRVAATGEQIAIAEEGCNGWERTSLSADARRVYLRSELACDGGTRRSTSGVLSFVTDTEWLDVQVVHMGTQSMTRVVRYRPAGPAVSLPAEIAEAAADRPLAVSVARAEAAAPLTVAQVIDASANLDGDAVQAWIVERGDRMAVDGDRLVEMADAGVPESVIDMVVATSFPNVFAVNREGQVSQAPRAAEDYAYPGYRDRPPVYVDYDPYYGGYGYSYRFGYRNLQYRYSPYGYGGYGYGGYGYSYRRPIIVVRGGGFDGIDLLRNNARVVRGRGYTRTSGSATGTGVYRGSTGSTSGAAASTSSSTGSSSTGRKAKPRTGGGGGG